MRKPLRKSDRAVYTTAEIEPIFSSSEESTKKSRHRPKNRPPQTATATSTASTNSMQASSRTRTRRAWPSPCKALQFFAGFEAYCLAGRNVYFFSGAWIAANAGFPRLYREHTKSSQLNALAAPHSVLQ